MANEVMVANFKSLSGIDVKLDANVVRSQLVRGNGRVSDSEIAFFIRTCQAKKLDPFENGEVFLVKYGDQAAQMVVGYHAYIRRAEQNPEYRGYKAGIVVARRQQDGSMSIDRREGAAVYAIIGETLIGGWCRVYRDRNGYIDESYMEVSLDEYVGRTKDGRPNSQWASKPATMIRKVAVSQCFRNAFPDMYEGLYTSDEMAASGAIPITPDAVRDAVPETVVEKAEVVEIVEAKVEEKKASREQCIALFESAKHLGEIANDVLKALLAKGGYERTYEVPEATMLQMTEMVKSMTEEDAKKLLAK